MEEKNSFPWSIMNEESRNQYWASLALRYAKGIGHRTSVRLLNAYGSAYAAIQNLPHWKDIGISAEKCAHVADGSWREQARIEWEDAQNLDAHILMWHEDYFPPRLRELNDAPILLYLKGDISLLKVPALAVVGARNCTREGLRIAGLFAKEISNCGLTVVSGMAYGVDKIAHTHALQGVGKSIGILGTGIDIMYPAANAKTYESMLESGLLISEFAPHTIPNAINFPIRNRIISGLSLGVLVIEASIRSGSLITARQALEQNREVYAIPGTMFSASASGCQELIRQGARAVFCVEDIIRDLEMQLMPYNISAATAHEISIQENNDKQMNLESNDGLCRDENSEFKAVQIDNQQDIKQNSGSNLNYQQDIKQNNSNNNLDFANSDNGSMNTAGKAVKSSPKETIAQRLPRNNMDKRPFPEGDAGIVVEFLSNKDFCHIDALSLELNKPISELNAILIKLEIEQWVSRFPGARYSLIK